MDLRQAESERIDSTSIAKTDINQIINQGQIIFSFLIPFSLLCISPHSDPLSLVPTMWVTMFPMPNHFFPFGFRTYRMLLKRFLSNFYLVSATCDRFQGQLQIIGVILKPISECTRWEMNHRSSHVTRTLY